MAALSSGPKVWDIFEWENVPRFGDTDSTFSFQIWLERGTDNITFTYGPSSGDTRDGTTGAENPDGNVGDTYYYDGIGTSPWVANDDLGVLSVPGTSGGSHTISFTAIGSKWGSWTNCAEMTSDLFQGTNIACFSGEVLRP